MRYAFPRGFSRRSLVAVLTVGAVSAAVYFGLHQPQPAVVQTVSPTQPATTRAATTSPSTKPAAPHDFLGVVKAAYPDFPATEPLALPVELHEGARLILHDPIFLDSAAELWITRADAPPTNIVLKKAIDETVHLTRERVLFVHHVLDEAGQWQPQPVCQQADGSAVLVSLANRLNLGMASRYHWDRAFSWNSTTNEGFVVPTDTGVSVFRPRSLPVESNYGFANGSTTQPATTQAVTRPTMAQPQMLLDSRGMLAWIPWDKGPTDSPTGSPTGSHGAARFIDGHWIPLGEAEHWPDKILHLVPLLDGSVIQIVLNDDATIGVSKSQLDTVDVDRKVIDPLIEQLSDPDPKVRDTATSELTRYGSGLWPILEKVIDDQPPEGHLRIEQLLSAKLRPTLGRMTLIPGNGKIIARLNDGGALLFAESGVSVPDDNPQRAPILTAPAYIAFRPGRAVEPASAFLVKDLPDNARIDVAGDEWIVTDDAHGPRRLLGNHLSPLLRKNDRAFSKFLGIDRQGRWLFRKPDADGATLVLDPSLPDTTPRLPAWIDPVNCDAVGWDDADWPVFSKNGSPWSLQASDWAPETPVDKGGKFYRTEQETPRKVQMVRPVAPVALAPATTQATTQIVASDLPILIDTDGTSYSGGLTELDVTRPDGTHLIWPLPVTAQGTGEVHLLKAGEGRLFLFNQPGRVLRILPTPGRAEPFKIEATFTDKIPNTDHYTRVWLDPAGRIDCAFDEKHVTVLFPEGRVPKSIAEKMPTAQLNVNDD